MTLGTILGAAFRVMRRNPRPTLGISVLMYILLGVLLAGFVSAFVAWSVGRISMSAGEAQDEIVAGTVLGGILSLIVPAASSVVLVGLLQGVVSLEVARGTLGEKLTTRQLLRLAKGRMAALIGWSFTIAGAVIGVALVGTAVVTLIIVFGGEAGLVAGVLLAIVAALAFVAGFAWIGTKLSLVPSALVLERLPLARAIARSWRLTDGAFWRTLGIELLVAAILSVAANVITTPLGLFLGIVLGLVAPTGDEAVTIAVVVVFYVLVLGLSTVLGAVSLVMQSSVTALIYLDLRMRREGLDLELMRFVEARAAGTEAPDPYRVTAPPGPVTAASSRRGGG